MGKTLNVRTFYAVEGNVEPRRDPHSDPRTEAAPGTTEVRRARARPSHAHVFEQAGVALVAVESGTIAAFNGAAEYLFQQKAEAVRGAPLESLFVPFHQSLVRDALRRAADGIPSFPSLLALRGHATPTEVSVRVGPLNVGGKVVGATLVVLDVRDQNRSVRELRAERDAAQAKKVAAEQELQRVVGAIREDRPPSEPPWANLTEPSRNARGMLVPGELFEEAIPHGANVVVDLSEALFGRFEGDGNGVLRIVQRILRSATDAGAVVMRGQVQARRSEWALIRLELVESDQAKRCAEEWAVLRRRATELEGAIGHELYAHGMRRIWMTFNMVGSDTAAMYSRQFADLKVALDLRFEAERAALARRLRSWCVEVRDFHANDEDVDLVISDRLPSSPNTIHLGSDIARPVRRGELHNLLSSFLARHDAA